MIAVDQQIRRNRYAFGIGTLGRDMVAAMVSIYLLYYLTDVIEIPDSMMGPVTAVFVATRVFDAVNDPFMGTIIDNTRSRWGKFRPWIGVGALAWGVTTVVLYIDTGLTGAGFLLAFTVAYVVWEIAYTVNDIAFWSMIPALSQDQRERERIGALARIFANVGLFALVVGIVPATKALGAALGGLQRGYLALAVIVVAVMLVFQLVTMLFVRETVAAPRVAGITLRQTISVIARNDQLLWVVLAMGLFMTGYTATASFGLYYFEYIFGDEDRYPVFALILGVSQLLALAMFPLFSRRMPRRRVHQLATSLVVAGYAVFFFADTSMLLIGAAGILLFFGQGLIQLLMLMFVADCVEYGEWKTGRRHEAITLSLQPIIYKGSNALATGIVGLTLIWSGVKAADSAADVTSEGAWVFKIAMMVVPMLLVIVSHLLMATKYVIDEQSFAKFKSEIAERQEVSP